MTARPWDAALIGELARVAGVEVDTSESATSLGARDFGGLARGSAAGVARPGSVKQIAEVVVFAGRHGLALTPRGAGLSQSGQAIPVSGLVLDLSAMRRVGPPDRERLSVESQPGATWRDVLGATLPLGLAPKVTPLNLDLTVGGTLSAGGMGSTSHRNGLAVSNILSAEVVLGTGDVVRCGPDLERRVYDAVFGGVGRSGVIASVEHSLEPVKKMVRTFFLLYDDLDALLIDQRALAMRGHAHHLEAFCSASIQGLRLGAGGRRQPLRHWLYGLHVSVAHDGHNAPSQDDALEGLRFERLLHTEDDELAPFLRRYEVRFDVMRATGAWTQAHPWIEALIPADSASEIIRAALELPAFLGDGHRITLVAERDHPAAVAFPEKGPTLVFAVLPIGIPEPFLGPALGALRAFDERIRALGGKRYLSGWLFDMGPDTWKTHYGADYGRLVELKRDLDPANVFRSCLSPLDPALYEIDAHPIAALPPRVSTDSPLPARSARFGLTMLAKRTPEETIAQPKPMRLVEIDSAHAVGAHKDLLVVIWRGETRPSAVARVSRALKDLSARYPKGVGLLQIVEVSVTPPDSDSRQALALMLKSAQGIVVCSSLAYLGTGFWMAAARAFVTGLTLLSRPEFPHVVFATTAEAADWHSRLLSDAVNRESIMAAVEALKIALDEHGPAPAR